MKKISVLIFIIVPFLAMATEISERNNSVNVLDNHTAREEAEGKIIWQKL